MLQGFLDADSGLSSLFCQLARPQTAKSQTLHPPQKIEPELCHARLRAPLDTLKKNNQWRLPKVGDPNMVPQIVASLSQRVHPHHYYGIRSPKP